MNKKIKPTSKQQTVFSYWLRPRSMPNHQWSRRCTKNATVFV